MWFEAEQFNALQLDVCGRGEARGVATRAAKMKERVIALGLRGRVVCPVN